MPRAAPSLAALAAASLVAVLALAPARARAEEATGEPRKPLDFEAVIETAKARVFPALVFVRPVVEDLSGGETRRVEVFGSGVIVSADGYVVTNHHVAEKAREIRCVLNDRRQVEAKVVGLDRSTDIALLKLVLGAGETVPFAELGSSASVTEGQFVMALGAPYGFERSISLGIVSNAKRQLGDSTSEDHLYNNWIQTDAAINPGNSGGPLVDTGGRVVGVNTLGIQMANNLGFAIPVDVVKRVVERLRTDGRVMRSRSGITLRPLVEYMQNTVFPGEKGVIVDDVAAQSPAEAAGFRKGDRILKVAGRETNGRYREDLPEIRWMLADLPEGEAAPIEVEREGGTVVLRLTPGEGESAEDQDFEAKRWNATFQAISPERTPDLAFYRAKGAYVLGVKFPGNAATSGVREGDIVLSLDKRPVPDLATLKNVYAQLMIDQRPKRCVLLEVLREGHRRHLALDWERDHEVDR